MHLFPRLLLTALLAGLLSGGLATVLHNLGTVPIILQAETYEQAAEAPAHHATPSPAQPPTASTTAPPRRLMRMTTGAGRPRMARSGSPTRCWPTC